MRSRPLVVAALMAALAFASCRSAAPPEPAGPQALWDPADAELLTWQADRPSFQQEFALEASGLAASDRFLYVASEKYARVLQLPIAAPTTTARVIAVAVPPHSELEGVAYGGGSLFFCDEAHAAVYEVPLPADEQSAGSGEAPPLPATELTLVGRDIQPGKVGVEGIVADATASRLWVLLEREGTPETGCVSTIYQLRRTGGALEEEGAPLTIALPDCDWRLTGLELWRGELLALKTQFPGERYEVIAIDPASGASRTVLELTGLLRSVRREGWHNNVEGIAVTPDGTLFLVSDNAWTLVIDDPEPPKSHEKTLLMRIPPSNRREAPP